MPPARVKARAAELFDFVKLRAPLDTVAGDLPAGLRQMVALCAALLHDPRLIFLDEPTAGSAPRTRGDFWALIRALAARGKTVFVTTHYMDEARYCARIALMDRGRIIALASTQELKKIYNAQNLDEVFIKALGARGAGGAQ